MKRFLFSLCLVAFCAIAGAQNLDPDIYKGQSCTSIMVGKKASADGSVITSHTCDGLYRTWMTVEPAADHAAGEQYRVYKGTMKTTYPADTTGVVLCGTIPQVRHTYAYLNTAYPCLNEHQLAMGETTFSGPEVLANRDGLFNIEELQRVALQRCTTAREAIRLIGQLIKTYGYGDDGECITIADPYEVWQMEILGEGKDKIGGVWAAQRIPDDEVGVSANIPRIGKMQYHNPDYFLSSGNCEQVAFKYGLWDGKEEFVFWKAFNSSYAEGKNFREREYFILNALAPSLHLSMDMAELPFSVKPDKNVDVRAVIELFRSTYEGTNMDMCKNVRMPSKRKTRGGEVYNDTIVSPIANPWLGSAMRNTLNTLKPGTIDFKRTVSVAWCAYSHVIQLRSWLPDAVGGVCWISVDNPGQSPRVPIFCGTTQLPEAFSLCGQKEYNPESWLWQFRKANKLATVAWQRTKVSMVNELKRLEEEAFGGLEDLEREAKRFNRLDRSSDVANLLNGYTSKIYANSTYAWQQLEAKYWSMFGMGF